MTGDGFDHVRRALPERICERVKNEAQVLAAQWAEPRHVPWINADLQPTRGHARAAGYIEGVALALDMTPLELLELCGATW